MHLRMLETAAARHNFRFDAVQMPLNVMDAHFRSFQESIALAGEGPNRRSGHETDGRGHHSAKQYADGDGMPALCDESADQVVITGCQNVGDVQQALMVARNFQQLTAAETNALLAKTAAAAKNGEFEGYKTTHNFDGTVHNPQWLG